MPDTTQPIIQVTDAYTVSANILALRIETGEVIRGQQTLYNPQPNDSINGSNILKRNGKSVGQLTGDRTMLRTFDQMVGPELDTNWADQAGSYRIRSGDGSNLTPTRVFRKSKPGDMAQTGPWDFEWPLEHTVFLEMPKPLEDGQTYQVDFSGDAVGDTTFTYDPASDRSEAVHVSHLGFDPDDPAKVAFLSTWMGTQGKGLDYEAGQKFWLVDEASGEKVYEGTVELSKDKDIAEDNRGRNYNGTDVYMMDFSEFDTEGTYRVVVDDVGSSFPIQIGEQTWADGFYVSARGMYHQRSGMALEAPYTDYERPRPFHPEDGVKVYQSTATLMDTNMGLNREVDVFDALVEGKTDQLVPEAWGGWFDAGDWDRRIQHLEVTRSMMELAELFPSHFDGVDLDIPESSNALPDVVDEALWGLDFFKRLQLPDGGIRGGVESAGHPEKFEASWQESQDVFVYAPDMWSSYKYAAAAAQAARVLEPVDAKRARGYEESAIKAMEWAEQEFAQGNPYEEIDDERNLAAAELYRTTGGDRWHQLFRDTTVFDDAKADVYQWKSHNQREAAFVYAQTEQAGVDATIKTNASNALQRDADLQIEAIDNTGFKWNKDPYAPLGWGTSFGAPQTSGLFRAHTLTGDEKYLKSGILATQFALGANPDNVSYTTGLGYRTPDSPFVADSIATGSAPPPGITLYGPLDLKSQPNYWAVDLFDQDTSPDPRQWPTAEGHFDVFWFIAHSEFTVMQSIGPTAYSLGYLAAVNGQGSQPTPDPTPTPAPEPAPTPDPVPAPTPTPKPDTNLDGVDVVAQLGLNEASGRTVGDRSSGGGDNPGTLQGDAAFVDAGKQGGGVRFDGQGDVMAIANSTDINRGIHPERTISFWFKSEGDVTGKPQVLYEEGGGTRGLAIYLAEDETGSDRLMVSGHNLPVKESGWSGTQLGTDDISSGQWHHVALVLDGGDTVTGDALRGYLDGVQFGSGQGSQLWGHTGGIGVGNLNGGNLIAGEKVSGGSYGFDGLMDEVMIANTALTAGQVEALAMV
ncbi:MAG: glycoside hydrolase family 9 protein [Elainellaceae cyanobacterium]